MAKSTQAREHKHEPAKEQASNATSEANKQPSTFPYTMSQQRDNEPGSTSRRLPAQSRDLDARCTSSTSWHKVGSVLPYCVNGQGQRKPPLLPAENNSRNASL